MYNKDTVRMMPHGGDRPVFFLFFCFYLRGRLLLNMFLCIHKAEVCLVSKYFCMVYDASEMMHPTSSKKEKENYKLFNLRTT